MKSFEKFSFDVNEKFEFSDLEFRSKEDMSEPRLDFATRNFHLHRKAER